MTTFRNHAIHKHNDGTNNGKIIKIPIIINLIIEHKYETLNQVKKILAIHFDSTNNALVKQFLTKCKYKRFNQI